MERLLPVILFLTIACWSKTVFLNPVVTNDPDEATTNTQGTGESTFECNFAVFSIHMSLRILECHYSGRVINNDPCQPWCVCNAGKTLCAQISCSKIIPDDCEVIQVSNRCCPTLMCGKFRLIYTEKKTVIDCVLIRHVFNPACFQLRPTARHQFFMNFH